jgi:hypothetical protein
MEELETGLLSSDFDDAGRIQPPDVNGALTNIWEALERFSGVSTI